MSLLILLLLLLMIELMRECLRMVLASHIQIISLSSAISYCCYFTVCGVHAGDFAAFTAQLLYYCCISYQITWCYYFLSEVQLDRNIHTCAHMVDICLNTSIRLCTPATHILALWWYWFWCMCVYELIATNASRIFVPLERIFLTEEVLWGPSRIISMDLVYFDQIALFFFDETRTKYLKGTWGGSRRSWLRQTEEDGRLPFVDLTPD